MKLEPLLGKDDVLFKRGAEIFVLKSLVNKCEHGLQHDAVELL